MKKVSLLLACLVVSVLAMAQKPVISFEEKTFDFGKVKEEDGKITHVFEFVNKGSGPLVINRAQAQCGCTTPVWTKEPIEPGKRGTITVTYNPQGRPGPFTKTITVYSNATEEQAQLIIKGEVISKQTAEENSPYPATIDGLKLKSKLVQMNNIEKGKIQTRSLEIKNAGTTPLVVKLLDLPSYIDYAVSPSTLKPNEEGKITFEFNSKNCDQWGPLSLDFYVALNGVKKKVDANKLTIVGNVIEDFSKLTLDQKRKAPILEMPSRSLNLGVVKQGSVVSGKLILSNKGQNSLEVRRVINNNKELTIRSEKISVSSGKSHEFKIDLNTKTQVEGDYKRYITVQTNDPDNSFVMIIITWKVQK